MHTYRAQDMLPYDDPHWMGGVGPIGGQPGVDAVEGADLLLMLGSDHPYREWLPQGGNVIQVDERATVLGRRAVTKLGIVGSVKPTLRMPLERLPERSDTAFLDKVAAGRRKWNAMLDEKADPARSADKIHLQAIARAVSDRAADDAIFVTDSGLATLWVANWTRPSGRQRFTGFLNNQLSCIWRWSRSPTRSRRAPTSATPTSPRWRRRATRRASRSGARTRSRRPWMPSSQQWDRRYFMPTSPRTSFPSCRTSIGA